MFLNYKFANGRIWNWERAGRESRINEILRYVYIVTLALRMVKYGNTLWQTSIQCLDYSAFSVQWDIWVLLWPRLRVNEPVYSSDFRLVWSKFPKWELKKGVFSASCKRGLRVRTHEVKKVPWTLTFATESGFGADFDSNLWVWGTFLTPCGRALSSCPNLFPLNPVRLGCWHVREI